MGLRDIDPVDNQISSSVSIAFVPRLSNSMTAILIFWASSVEEQNTNDTHSGKNRS